MVLKLQVLQNKVISQCSSKSFSTDVRWRPQDIGELFYSRRLVH